MQLTSISLKKISSKAITPWLLKAGVPAGASVAVTFAYFKAANKQSATAYLQGKLLARPDAGASTSFTIPPAVADAITGNAATTNAASTVLITIYVSTGQMLLLKLLR